MTKRNKLIVGGVAILGAFYLYDRNNKMKAVAQLKAQEDREKALGTKRPMGSPSVFTMEEKI